MLIELKRAHQNLIALIAELERLSVDHFDEAAVGDVRWKMTRESNKRRRLLEDVIFPYLLARISNIDALKVIELQNEATVLRNASSLHIGEWTRSKIAADWPGYQRASNLIRASMRQRIANERSVLYPLLDRYRG